MAASGASPERTAPGYADETEPPRQAGNWGGRLLGALHGSQGRAERLVVAGRFILASCSLFAIWLDPVTPDQYVVTAYAALSGYVIDSLGLPLVVWFLDSLPRLLGFGCHVFDLAAFSGFMLITQGPTSPFFAYFMFALVSATLRWGWRGTPWTAGPSMAIFVALAGYTVIVLDDPGFELNRFVIRCSYFVVVTGLLCFLAAYEERQREELSALASWPRAPEPGQVAPTGAMLELAARVLHAPRVVMVWEEDDEPWLFVAEWARGALRNCREAPGTWHPLCPARLHGVSFLC